MSEVAFLLTMFVGCSAATVIGAVGAVLLLRVLGLAQLPGRVAQAAPTGAGYWESLVDCKTVPIDPARLGERLSFERALGWRPDSTRVVNGTLYLTMRRQVRVWVGT